MITADTIISTLEGYVKEKHPIAPSLFLDAAQKLNLLLSDENDKLYELEHTVAIKRAELVQEMTAAKAKMIVEATEEYKLYRKQKARVEQIVEFIRISKVQGKMRMEEYKAQ